MGVAGGPEICMFATGGYVGWSELIVGGLGMVKI